jgi:hypothetical protein
VQTCFPRAERPQGRCAQSLAFRASLGAKSAKACHGHRGSQERWT